MMLLVLPFYWLALVVSLAVTTPLRALYHSLTCTTCL